ncbi:hypothetical protein EDF56_101317 [Novosphingobium sp. PhB165]|uniref:DUF5694 domain-containing protein n=1 Tax=Novosphingobium sp. PhB165 TaxID=2485105 RepID=UPI0010EFD9C9|nr:DUF5694 domain-containing protein [Novosphingobium sp. PhB165]TCM21648.1 hypothetical protein EDF56_101317 [Novosphingobium sp. PhB165]
MVRLRNLFLACGFCLAAGQFGNVADAQDYHPVFHPGELKGPPAGWPNEVMVLGTPHLSDMPDTFRLELVDPVVARLAAWRPTAIATEDMSGLQCDSLRRYPSRYAETVEAYCPDPTLAGKATGLDVPAANAEAERLLAAWPTLPLSAQRRHLAAVFLAAGEPGSALVQWLRLPEAERREGDGLTVELAAKLDKRKDQHNETNLIAARLAAKLGLERLWSVDDHSADMPESADPKAYDAAISHAWDNPATHQREADGKRLNAGLDKPDGLLALYRAYNDPSQAQLVYRSDFGAALVEPSPQGFGRNYVGYWETRNLRMVANIRDVLGRYPGTRLLAIVGASHKAYYEAYLDQMHDVKLVDAEAVLR